MFSTVKALVFNFALTMHRLSAKVGLKTTVLKVGHSWPLEYSVRTLSHSWLTAIEQLTVNCGT